MSDNMSISQRPVARKFHDLPKFRKTASQDEETLESVEVLLKYIYENVIGREKVFSGPFGFRNVVYTDYTASGKSLQFIEDYIRDEILPEYGNTHTTTSVTSLQTTMYRHEARDIVRNAVNASEHDAVIFTGSGCTGAVHKLIHALNLDRSPVIFVGPYEHHSNLLPWREIGADIIRIKEDSQGAIDLNDLLEQLRKYETITDRLKIGCFCAASNITGILVDVDTISSLLHTLGCLAFWDYASAAPYTAIDMNPIEKPETPQCYKDAVFLSPHKFVGGIQTTGLLVAKKKLFNNKVPSEAGGGTVFFVRRNGHRYQQEVELREEGGTPAIVESIRVGLIFQLKRAVGTDIIMELEENLTKKAFSKWENLENLKLLGGRVVPRLPIFSFVVKHKSLFLHHNFVCAVLNDVFGIQARGGCACAGPYAEDLLGIDEKLAKKFEELLAEDDRLDRVHLRRYGEYSNREILRPGFVRLNLPYFAPEEEIDFILEAVAMTAENAWILLPQYTFNPETGEWRHKNLHTFKSRKWLGNITYKNGKMEYTDSPIEDRGPLPKNFSDCLRKAEEIFQAGKHIKTTLGDQRNLFDEESSKFRWFILPSEISDLLSTPNMIINHVSPFQPIEYSNNTVDSSDKKKIFSSIASNRRSDSSLAKSQASDSQKSLIDFFESGFENKSEVNIPKVAEKSSEDDYKPPAKKEKMSCPLKIRKRKSTEEEDRGAMVVGKWYAPPKPIFKPMTEAIEEFSMIKNNDKLLVCLSGGKDSLSLLHAMHQYQFYAKSKGIEFQLGAVTIDPQAESYNPRPLKAYLASLNVPYFYEEQDIIGSAKELGEGCTSICSFCSRMKRGRIYHAARREGYNVLALGQHRDDLAESFMMSLFHNGLLRTMKACYTVKEGDLRVIRPLVYVREKELRKFAEQNHLPIISENCPACFELPKERHRMKQLLASQEVIHPRLFNSISSAIHPIIAIPKTGVSLKNMMGTSATEDDKDDEDF
ncbi:DgyrCDS1743 [Dimorphilus gyrociliatus]|uniref:DgyrCDS1743 n=1 Tax=Dimorphilus gyrociliatus TaxID=2664684 RepID=A0A7I8VBF4_9ANNE|nr:DgyrCDS1743 [Dimorphilus gyrociliatus]